MEHYSRVLGPTVMPRCAIGESRLVLVQDGKNRVPIVIFQDAPPLTACRRCILDVRGDAQRRPF